MCTFGVLRGREGPGEDVGGEVEQVQAVGDGGAEAEVGQGRAEAWEDRSELTYGSDDFGDWAGEVARGNFEAGWTCEVGVSSIQWGADSEKEEEGECERGCSLWLVY